MRDCEKRVQSAKGEKGKIGGRRERRVRGEDGSLNIVADGGFSVYTVR